MMKVLSCHNLEILKNILRKFVNATVKPSYDCSVYLMKNKGKPVSQKEHSRIMGLVRI